MAIPATVSPAEIRTKGLSRGASRHRGAGSHQEGCRRIRNADSRLGQIRFIPNWLKPS